jgi:hypothetical protein
MTRRTDELDRLINALNAGEATALPETTDSELPALMEAVLRIRRLQQAEWPEADWPDQAVAYLAHELRSNTLVLNGREPRQALQGDPGSEKHPEPAALSHDRALHKATSRRRFPRELAQIAAAIAVLVVVAGVLAVVFRGQGGSDQEGIGGSGTPTEAANAPLPTPDASGQYHNLTLAQAQQLAPFHLAKPAWIPSYLHDEQITASVTNITEDQPGTPTTSTTLPTGAVQVVSVSYWGLYPRPPAVTINELKQGTPLGPAGGPSSGPGINSTTITIAGHAVTRTTWAISAVSPPSGPSAKYVWTDQGSTFQLMALITEPSIENDVEHMIASMLGQSTGQATPTSSGVSASTGTGSDNNMTVTQAQEQVGFKIIEPKSLPAPLTPNPHTVNAYQVVNSAADHPNYVELFYPLNPPSSQQGMFLVETTNHAAVPTINGATASIVSPLSPNGPARTMTVIRGTEAEMGIQGVVVTKFEVADSDSRQTYFVWTFHGVSSYIEVTRSGSGATSPVDEAQLQQMVGGLIKERRGPGLTSSLVFTDLLALLRGIILVFILVAVYRMRHRMLFAKAVFVIVALFTAFIFVDGIVSGPWIADVGFVVGGALVLAVLPLYDRWRHPRNHAAG